MRKYEAISDNTARILTRLDVAIEWLVIGLLAFMPLASGVVHAWSEEIFVALFGIIVICFLLRVVLCGGAGMVWSWSYVPVALFLLI